MELALYEPNHGYYRAPATRPGRGGDFLTAPEAHPIFGRALGRHLIEHPAEEGEGAQHVRLVYAGHAGRGVQAFRLSGVQVVGATDPNA